MNKNGSLLSTRDKWKIAAEQLLPVLGGFLLVGAIVGGVAACSTPAAYQDKGGVNGAQPDKISDVDYTEVFRNSDGVPTIAMSCIRGLAFASPASSYAAGESSAGGGTYFFRLPEWDATCKTKVKP